MLSRCREAAKNIDARPIGKWCHFHWLQLSSRKIRVPLPPPAAAPRGCVRLLCRAPSSGVAVLPQCQGQKWEISATLLTLPFHCVPKSWRKNGTAWSLLVRAPGAALGTRALHLETSSPLGKGLLRVWPLVSRCPRSSGWIEPLMADGATLPRYSWSLWYEEGNYFWIFSMAGGLFLAGGATESERGPSAGSSLRPYLTFRQLSLSLSKGHG